MQESSNDGLRILMVLSNQVGRGTYWRALNLARGLDRRGCTVNILAISPKERFKIEVIPDDRSSVKIVKTPDLFWGSLRSGWDLWDVLMRIRWIRENPSDLVHSFESRPVAILPALYSRRRYKQPMIIDWCDWFGEGGSVEQRTNKVVKTVLRPVETYFENNFRTWATGTTVISRFLKEKAVNLGVDPSTITIVPNGSSVDELWPIPTSRARKELNLHKDDFTIGYMGAIFEQDARFLADAFNMAVREIPDLKMLIIGYCNIDIRSLVKAPESITVTGKIPYQLINLYLGACDLCLLPLKSSGANRGRFPLKLNDYMSAGRPVLATDVGEIGDFVRQHDIGWVVNDEPLEFANQLIKISEQLVEREQIGQRARTVAENLFTWDQLAGNLENFYRNFTAQPN